MIVNKPIVAVAALIFVLAAAGVYFLRSRNAPLPPAPVAAVNPAPAPAEPGISHPLPKAGDNAGLSGPLPNLADSDPPLHEALAQLTSADAVKQFLVPQDLVRKMVVTIDNLPRQKVAVEKRPINPIAGSFMATGDELHATLDQRNFERYKPMVTLISHLDMKQLAAVYVHFYPLFQESYQNLGYPNGYFNDRLVEVIDSLLAAPEPKTPIDLVRPNVMYTYADKSLEARPAGQKLLVRMGPENAKAIKAKLIELRAAVTAASLKH